MGAALFSSSLSVFAYSPKSVIYTEEVFDQLIVSDYEEKVYKDLPVNKNGGWVFFDEDGTILVELDELSLESEAYSTCRHTYESCKATNHIKYPDNSCKVEYYYAQKCSNCGNLKLGDLFNTATNTFSSARRITFYSNFTDSQSFRPPVSYIVLKYTAQITMHTLKNCENKHDI